jgi:hypothetical protein
MSKFSVYVIACNDEPNMRVRLESMAGWDKSWLLSLSQYRSKWSAYIEAGSGITTVTA